MTEAREVGLYLLQRARRTHSRLRRRSSSTHLLLRQAVASLRACLAALATPSGLAGQGDACGGKAGSSMCTVGLMLNGCAIDDTMPGSPSFLSGQIKVPSRVPAQRRASTSAH